MTRVTINEEGEWSLLMNDVDGACVHMQCFGGVSYCMYEDLRTDSSSVVSKLEKSMLIGI